MRTLPDRGFLLGGTDDARDGEGWLVQTDSLGNLVWQGAWGDITRQNWDHITCAQPTKDGGCIAFGCSYTYATPSFDAWMLKIDSLCLTGVAETMNDERETMNAGPTIVRGVLNLQSAIYNLQSEIALLDISGRKVLDLRCGPNDVSRLAPGVYFVQAVSRELSAASCHKVIMTR